MRWIDERGLEDRLEVATRGGGSEGATNVLLLELLIGLRSTLDPWRSAALLLSLSLPFASYCYTFVVVLCKIL